MEQVKQWADELKKAIGTVFFGKESILDTLVSALLCRGHVLIEDVPGVGKTILAKALALSLEGDFNQVQCTPDLLPADVLGVSVFNQATGEFTFKEGPVITNILLVDEINRATPRTQSALLEAMAEGQVSVEGKSIPLPSPFFMIATESPSESEGTFPLPEVQKDRFFCSFSIGYPDTAAEKSILKMKSSLRSPLKDLKPVSGIDTLIEMQKAILDVHIKENLLDYIYNIINTTRDDHRLVLGVSPRGSLALFRGAQALAAIRNRNFITPEDIKDIAVPVLRKRILIKSEFGAKGLSEEQVIEETLEKNPVPGLDTAAAS